MTAEDPLILLVEDEPQLRRYLRVTLGPHGYRLLEAGTAREGELMASSHHPDLILLDLGLPDMDGLELTRRLREWCATPIIVVSARGLEQDKILALDAGADDYLTKPFGSGELLARIRVGLRHGNRDAAAPETPVFELGEWRIDQARRHHLALEVPDAPGAAGRHPGRRSDKGHFAARHPDRFFDVGIAEEHAALFAAGMATRGMKPFLAIYSTFMQRAFDMIVHDIALQNLNVALCMDRACEAFPIWSSCNRVMRRNSPICFGRWRITIPDLSPSVILGEQELESYRKQHLAYWKLERPR